MRPLTLILCLALIRLGVPAVRAADTPVDAWSCRVGTPLPVAGISQDDLVLYGEGGDHCYLYLAERKLPAGNRHVIVSGLDLLSDTPEGLAIWSGILGRLGQARGTDSTGARSGASPSSRRAICVHKTKQKEDS